MTTIRDKIPYLLRSAGSNTQFSRKLIVETIVRHHPELSSEILSTSFRFLPIARRFDRVATGEIESYKKKKKRRETQRDTGEEIHVHNVSLAWQIS